MKIIGKSLKRLIAMLVVFALVFSWAQPVMAMEAAAEVIYDPLKNGVGEKKILVDQTKVNSLGKNEDYGYFLLDKTVKYKKNDIEMAINPVGNVVKLIVKDENGQEVYTNGTDYVFNDNKDGNGKIEFYPLPGMWDTMVANSADSVTFSFNWTYIIPNAFIRKDLQYSGTAHIKYYRPTYRFSNIEILDQAGNTVGARGNSGMPNYCFNSSNCKINGMDTIKARLTLEAADPSKSNELVQSFGAGTVGLISGNTTELYPNGTISNKVIALCDSIEKNGNTVTLKFILPSGVTSESDGISLVFQGNNDNMKQYFGGAYWELDDNKYAYFSNCKVDTKEPVFTIEALDNEKSWAAVHKFRIKATEGMTDSLVNYELWGANIPITDYLGGSPSIKKNQQTIPVGTDYIDNTTLNLKIDGKYEGKYVLRVFGDDLAGNMGQGYVQEVWLDNKAPAVSVTADPKPQAADGSKSTNFIFNIEDISGTGRVYYCFVKYGEQIPAKDTDQWSFVDKMGTTATAVCKAGAGENFVGTMYYYTTDDSGNDSYKESGAYYSQQVNIYNDKVTTQLEIKNAAKGLPEYQVSYDGKGLDTLQYKWIDMNIIKSGFEQNSFTQYNGSTEIGGAIHTGDDGKQYTFDGTYKLVYKITNKTSSNFVEGDYTFVFDNSTPSIELPKWANGTKIRDTQQAAIRITDKGAIKEASYQVVDIDNKPIEMGGVKLPEVPVEIENDGSVNTTVNITVPDEIGSGIYGIIIRAKDMNGNYKTVGYNYLDRTPGIIDDGKEAKDYENPAMRLGIRKDKPELAIASVSGTCLETYNSGYRTGQSDYTVKLKAQEAMRGIGAFSYSTYLKYQISSDGTNWSAWKDAECMDKDSQKDFSYLNYDISNPYPLNIGENYIYIRTACYNYDPAIGAADKQEELDRTPDAKYISDPVTISIELDKTSAEYDLEYASTNRTNQDVSAILTINNKFNKVYNVIAEDSNIKVDKESNEKYKLTISKNVNATVKIEDNLGNITNAVVKVDWIDRDGPAAELISKDEIVAGARKDAVLSVIIKDTEPDTTEFALVEQGGTLDDAAFTRFRTLKEQGRIQTHMIAAAKSYGENDEAYTLTLKGITGEYLLGYRAKDSLENTASMSISGSGVSLMDAEISEPAVTFNPVITKTNTVASVKFNVPVVILPDSMVTSADDKNLELASEYGKASGTKFSVEHKFVYSDKRDRTYFAADEFGRAKKIVFAMDGVQFQQNGYESSSKYLLKGQAVNVNDGSWLGIEKAGDLQVEVSSNTEYEQYFYAFSSLGGGMSINKDLSSIAQSLPEEVAKTVYAEVYEPAVYTKVVFDVLINGSEEKQAQFKSYTMVGLPEDREQEESIIIGNIDETPPEVTWQLGNTAPTNQPVSVNINFNDKSGIAKVEELDGSGNYVEVDAAEYSKSNHLIRVLNESSEVKSIRVTNKAGLTRTVADIRAANIDKNPIEEGKHYTINYSYESYAGEWKPVKQGGYYRAVKATVIPAAGTGKTLYITNNNNSFEKLLTDGKPFTFDIVDSAGNQAQKVVKYDNYDCEIPDISYSVSPMFKTNKPVVIAIKATDKLNTIAGCELYFKKGNQLVKVEGLKAEAGSGEYTAEVKESGQYTAYVWDEAGNKGTRTIDITNIDCSPVEVKEIVYSVSPDKRTNQTVLATIKSFNKDNVIIFGIDIPEGVGLTQNDIVCSVSSASIRFKKNGSVEVTFADAYGNVGKEIITVNNITTEPPKCEGVVTLAPNGIYATISFASAKGPAGEKLEPDLGKIYVASGLLNSASVVTADKASIRINDNGTYKFTLSDEVGNSQVISVTVNGIDKTPPKVTGVSWKYDYLKENPASGTWEAENISGTDNAPGESNYVLSGEKLPETNQDVQVTVTTDKEITQIGSFDDMPRKDTSFVYSRNGVFSYNLEALNGTSVLYPVNMKLVDKDKPVIIFDNTSELIFIEGDARAESKYEISKLYDFKAYDMKNGELVEAAKEKVKVNFGKFDPVDINKNEFNRNKPYYITYTLIDGAGNKTEVARTVRLIGLTDTIALIDGNMPNANSMATVEGTDEFTVSLKNHIGKAYMKYTQGLFTLGEMKYAGKGVTQNSDGSFKIKVAATGWYTISVQTDKKDFFNIMVYVKLKEAHK